MDGIQPGSREDERIAWQPAAARYAASGLARISAAMGAEDYPALLQRIAADPEAYWRTALAELDLDWSVPFDDVWDLERGIAWPCWFPGARFNWTVTALDRWLERDPERIAVTWEGDAGDSRTLTWQELAAMTARIANGLHALGVGTGDTIGIFLPMCPETVALTLACGRIGAVYVPLFSGYGADAIVTRLENCAASILVTVDGFTRRGKVIDTKAIADAALAQLPGVQTCIVLERIGGGPMTPGRDISWTEAFDRQPDRFDVVDTAADDPCMILYTSGTTGRPKGAVHIHAGFPVKATHDLAYCFDLNESDVLFWYTDLGWMMGPWLICGGLMRGATIVLYEGTPDYPDPGHLWSIIARHRVTHFGVAPTAIRALMPHGDAPVRRHDLSSLRVLGSTGETWNPSPWWWYFEVVGERRCPIVNYSGGTETSGGIVSGFPGLPIAPASFTGPVPGMVADVVDEAGQPIRGDVGELVVRAPWVGMTNGFLGEPERYEETYWSRFADTWVHGDFAEIDDAGFWYIRGRSDDTINVAGKRIGPSEIESACVAHGTVREAAAIAVPHALKGDVVVVFAIAKPGEAPDAEMLRRHIGERLGGSLRPERVVLVDDLPRTRNAKIMRRTIRAAWLGLPAGDISALENPAAVDAIRAIAGH
jgi:acetyl-CoA synthetase